MGADHAIVAELSDDLHEGTIFCDQCGWGTFHIDLDETAALDLAERHGRVYSLEVERAA
ncbi:MAG: hypothetical protein IE926_04750 [Micrococcales bacterium]|nr:hypothetical protein [Micrococcales bacterium]